MMRTPVILTAFAIASHVCLPAAAGTAFGTEQEARDIARQMVNVIRTGGVDAGIEAMHDPDHPFVASNMGIHVFEETIIVADNREPELIATSYADLQDLTGETMWPRIIAAADTGKSAVLEWFHYDTEAEYSYDCFSQWAEPGSVLVMVCR